MPVLNSVYSIGSKRDLFSLGSRVKGSVLDTKETFVQFSSSKAGGNCAKNSFVTTTYRHRNLDLAEWLEKTQKGFMPKTQTNKTIRNIRFCSSSAIIAATKSDVSIATTSKSCKSPHCAICARSRSTKISKRLVSALHENPDKLFTGKHFYFLTFTVKHDKGTRTGVYLKEFKQYMLKMYRSKFWKSHFPYSTHNKKSGWITAYETTLNDKTNGYHIHAHVLVCAPQMKKRAKDFEKELQAKWKKITTDSFIVRFDLLNIHQNISALNDDEAQKEVYNAVRELIKYGTKSGNFKTWNYQKATLYSDWIESTKGGNFINASGLFRGMQLTGLKSKYDELVEHEPIDDTGETAYFIGKTSQIKYNHGTKYIDPKVRQKILKNVQIKRADEFHDITNIAPLMWNARLAPIAETKLADWLEFKVELERRNAAGNIAPLAPLPSSDFNGPKETQRKLRFPNFEELARNAETASLAGW